MTPALQTRNLAVGYRHQRQTRAVLSDVNVTVDAGEIVCLLGVNGSGKSTLMRTLAKAQPALSGSVEINGADITRMSHADLARKIGIVLTERVAVGAMEARQLVELGRYPHVGWAGGISDLDREIVQEAIVAVGAQHLAHRDVNELSDGERQRIMIARALAQRPAVLLLDEPSAFLDVSARVEIMVMLRRLAREKNVAVILSSHDLDLSLRTSDTIWLFDGAGGMTIGAPEDLLADGSVASIFSSANIAFSAEERTFKNVATPLGTAFIAEAGNSLSLVRSLLEREGYKIIEERQSADLSIQVTAAGWEAEAATRSGRGTKFAELARFVRQPMAPPPLPNPPDNPQ